MWKITRSDSHDAVTLELEGRFVGSSIAELVRVWRSLAPTLGSKTLRIDLRGITHMNWYGLGELAKIHKRTKAVFLANSPLTNYLAEQAQGHASSNEWLCQTVSKES